MNIIEIINIGIYVGNHMGENSCKITIVMKI